MQYPFDGEINAHYRNNMKRIFPGNKSKKKEMRNVRK